MLPKVELHDLVELNQDVEVTENLLVNVRGCNGSGKSTIPLSMLETDENSFEVVWQLNGKERVLATVFPKYKFAAIGHYHSKCGGMDSMKNTDEIKLAVDTIWDLNYNIIMEGIMASTVRQTYIDLFSGMNESHSIKRDVVVFNILPPLNICLGRIQERNGGKPIKEELVLSKWKTVDNNVQHFKNAGFTSIRVSNENVDKSETLQWFFNSIHVCSEVEEEDTYVNCPVEDKSTLSEYEWYKYYKEPNDKVKMSSKYLDRFWWFMYERLKVYHKRVVLNQDYPWTDDVILNTYRFTNICRDMDKLSIYERKNILSKLDDEVDDMELRKKSVMFNIMLFRTFVKVQTYEAFGFIDFSDKNWKKQWEKGKKLVLSRREQGVQSFTGAFMVPSLKQCNPNYSTRNNKTLNALYRCEYFIDNLDTIYDRAINQCSNMDEQLRYLRTLRGVGDFTAYEFACSFAMASRYCKNHLVPWTQDNYTSIGPGSRGGLEWIFKDFGNLTEIESIIYLRTIWRKELKRLGYYDEFMSMLPKELGGDIDLRVIEHCLCETTKYNKVATSTGRPKEKFEVRTNDMKELLM